MGTERDMDVLDHWCERETRYWADVYCGSRDFAAEHDRINAEHLTIFIVEIADGDVYIRAKPGVVEADGTIHGETQHGQRILLYRDFIQAAVRLHLPTLRMTFALDVHDISEWNVSAPIFSFQKKAGSRNILMPDIDFMNHDWYRQDHVEPPLADKTIAATFVGASTGGGILTHDVVARDGAERLALAAAFVGNRRVRFSIAQAVQCDTHDTAVLLTQKPYFTPTVPWAEQLRSQFIFSVDGNGATCSRVVNTLRSRSVLLKYTSHNLLYYFRGLEPWKHYIPVDSPADVESVLDDHINERIDVATIVRNANRFHARYLSYGATHLYMAKLILRYAAAIAPSERGGDARCETPMLALVRAHFSNVGDLEFVPGRPVSAPQGNMPMEGVQLVPGGGIDPAALRYRSRSADAGWGEWTPLDGFSGTRGCNSPIVDLDFALSETARSTYRLATAIVLDDGTIRRSDDGRATAWVPSGGTAASPVVRLTLDLTRI